MRPAGPLFVDPVYGSIRSRIRAHVWFLRRDWRPVFEKMQADYQRFLEIERLLLDPEVMADVSRVTALAKERGKLAKLAVPYGRYLDLGRQIAEAEALFAAETDPEMRSYAIGEIETLRQRHASRGRGPARPAL